jgi:dihydrofolate reductase
MARLFVFNSVTLDGYFTDASGNMNWAHKNDPEWLDFTISNAQGNATLLFGRVTYQLMASFWPTPAALQQMPDVAKRMNSANRVVFSRTLDKAEWSNTQLVKSGLIDEVQRLKRESLEDILIMGSGTIIAQLAPHGLIDEFQIVLNPIALGSGRTMFEGIDKQVGMRRTKSRTFENGNVVLWYEPVR